MNTRLHEGDLLGPFYTQESYLNRVLRTDGNFLYLVISMDTERYWVCMLYLNAPSFIDLSVCAVPVPPVIGSKYATPSPGTPKPITSAT
jgi:hypothetical protein